MRRLSISAAVFAAALALSACHAHSQTQAADGATPKSDAYMAKIEKDTGVIALPSGVAYKVVKSAPAGAPAPKVGDEVKVNYEGTLPDGTVFDSSYKTGEPVVFPVGGLIPAWNEILPKMHVGDTWILYVPPSQGYGPEGKGPIPPDTVMVFKLELLGVLPSAGGGLG
jgi:peptidylprolyl isomerase/FKBP-type peptidyl-prolyl cis-trans isomerase FklB